jgi:GT2 family glycosyltransferase
MTYNSPISNIDISIIIVNWNTKRLLIDCIQSIYQGSSHLNIEIIVVDNASIDGSVEAVRSFYPDVLIISNEHNLGFAKANNIGIQQSNGRYICLSNTDIKVLDHAILSMIKYLDTHPNTGVLGPKTLNSDLSLRMNCRSLPSYRTLFNQAMGLNRLLPNFRFFSDDLMSYFDHLTIANVDILPGCFLIVRREALYEVGVLDENFFFYGEDKDWCKRFLHSGWGITFYPLAEVIHYAGKSSEKAPTRYKIQKFKSNRYYWEKHYGPRSANIYLIIQILNQIMRVLISFVKPPFFIAVRSDALILKWLFLYLIYGSIPKNNASM